MPECDGDRLPLSGKSDPNGTALAIGRYTIHEICLR